MGCLQSRKECSDSHPNVFRVTNIDESGNELWGGQLELTETDLILCREGREDTVWPLPSLRRYGFDGDVFSFESGRRCPTGEGIYAFRCRRANVLFSQLQNNIQLRNVIHESMQFTLPSNIMAGSPSAIPRATLQASVVHRSSVDNGQPRNMLRSANVPGHHAVAAENQSPRSLSNADILEVTPLYPRPHSNATQVTNLYQVKEFKSREHNNNQSEQSTEVAHVYTNDNDLTRSLAKLRNELRDSTARSNFKDMIEETAFLQTVSSNKSPTPTSPTASTTSDHDQVRLYQNIRPTEIAKQEFLRSFEVPSTPLTSKQPEYCNFSVNNRPELNYANLNVGEMEDCINSMKNNVFVTSTDLTHKLSESDTNASMSPTEEVNYAVLDMEAKEAGKVGREVVSPESHSVSSSRHESTTSQCSVPQPGGARHLSSSSIDNASAFAISAAPGSVGYTTIDFDKTVALTSVVTGTDMESDGTRKSRHDSSCASPIKAK